MRFASSLAAPVVLLALAVGAGLYWRLGGAPLGNGPQPTEARPAPERQGIEPRSALDPEAERLVIHGHVQARVIDPKRWSVRGTPMRFGAEESVARSEVNSRGRFELVDLLDVDYRVELVAECRPPFVLASIDYVRPGGEELVIEIDPAAARAAEAALAKE